MKTYTAIYKGRTAEFTQPSLFHATLAAIGYFNVPRSRRTELSVVEKKVTP